MELNINFNLNITIKHENQQSASIDNCVDSIRKLEPVKPNTTSNKYRRKPSFHITKSHYSRVQEKVNEIANTTKGLTKVSLFAKAAYAVKVPVNFSRIHDIISVPSGYHYFQGRHMLTEENYKDIAALMVGGAGKNATIMAIETCTDFCCVKITQYKRSVTQKDVERVKEKYKNILMLYGVYDRMVYDKKQTHAQPSSRAKHTHEESMYNKQNRMRFTHDQVCEMVKVYESLPVSSSASFGSDMRYMCKKFGVGSAATMQRILFAHTGVPGYEDIPIPDVKNITKNTDNRIASMIEEIRYLRDVKKFGAQKISTITGFKYDFVKRAYSAVLRPDIKVEPKMKEIFDQRYKGVK